MKRLTRMFAVAAPLVALAAIPALMARAEHFDIVLRVEADGAHGEAYMDTTPPIGGVNPRPVVHMKAGSVVTIAWRMKSGYPHGTMKDVGVHFFVVHEDALGQKPVPDPAGKAGVLDNHFSMDFAPSAAASGYARVKLTEPGAYLVRLQSENTFQEHGHEHFSAVDVQVE